LRTEIQSTNTKLGPHKKSFDALSGLNAIMPNSRNSSASASALQDLYERSGSDELLELLIEVSENISEALVVYDSDGRLVLCNRNFREL
jgi:PAS domain-containing protein